MTTGARKRQPRIRPRGHLLSPAQSLPPLFPTPDILAAPTIPPRGNLPLRIEIPRPDLPELEPRDGSPRRGDPVGQVAYLVVGQTDVERRQVVSGEVFEGYAGPGPGAGVAFRLAGEDALTVHVFDAEAGGDEGGAGEGGGRGGHGGELLFWEDYGGVGWFHAICCVYVCGLGM